LWHNLDRPVLAGNTRKFADPGHRPFVELFEATAFDLLVTLGYEPLYATRRRSFSASEVAGFVAHDRALRAAARRAADPAVEALHRPQEEFIRRLRDLRGAGAGRD
jgi:hypothetical protein